MRRRGPAAQLHITLGYVNPTEGERQLVEAVRGTLALAGAQGALRAEIGLLIEHHQLFEREMAGIENQMAAALEGLPEAAPLLSIPMVAPVTAAIFLGSIGDPQAYDPIATGPTEAHCRPLGPADPGIRMKCACAQLPTLHSIAPGHCARAPPHLGFVSWRRQTTDRK